MIAEMLGQAEYVTVGKPRGRYWVYDVNAPGGANFATLASRPGMTDYYSNLEIALMAQHPELFNRGDPELDAFITARIRAMQPGIDAKLSTIPGAKRAVATADQIAANLARKNGGYGWPIAAGIALFSMVGM